MKNLIAIFDEIGAEPSKTGKKAIVEKHKGNSAFVNVLNFIYNPKVLTGLSRKKLNKKVKEGKEATFPIKTINEVMDYLKNNPTGTDEVIINIQSYIEGLETFKEKEFINGLVTKDVKVGITSKTINKALGYDLIAEFDVMRASRYKGEPIGEEFAITLKEDGIHCVAINTDNGVEFISRQGEVIEGLIELEEEFKTLPKNHVYCGELLYMTYEDLSSSEIYRKTASIVNSDGEKRDISFNVFDNLPLDEFNDGKSKDVYTQRMARFDAIYFFNVDRTTVEELKFIKPITTLYIGTDESVIEPLLNSVLEAKKEGLMINTVSGLYEIKRSKAVLKVKKFYFADLEVTGYKEHKHKNKMGSFTVDYKGNSLSVPVHKHDEQIEFWEQREELIGRVIEVKFFEQTENKKGGVSLRFPVFARLREEGKEVSYE